MPDAYCICAPQFLAYFGYMTESYTTRVLDNIFAKGGGLYTARTVREWLWEGQDPLLQLVAPELASKSVLVGNEVILELNGTDGMLGTKSLQHADHPRRRARPP